MLKGTVQTLIEQMRISDLEIAGRKKLFNLTEGDIRYLVACKPVIEDSIDKIVNQFYQTQTEIDEIALLIGDADTLARLRLAQRGYVLDLFNGIYDSEYVNQRLRIGLVHKRIGVEPKLYLSAVKTLQRIIVENLECLMPDKDEFKSVCAALDKLVFFDITLVFDTYIRSMLREIESAKKSVETYATDLESKVAQRTRQLEELSRRDPLTNLNNVRAFKAELRREIAHAQRNSLPISLVYLDVNNFKEINDQQGHYHGDRVLKTIADSLQKLCREPDIPCRYGGDEFCVLMPGVEIAEAKEFCDRLAESIADKDAEIRASIGVVQTVPGMKISSDELLKRADLNMYKAKKGKSSHIYSEVLEGREYGLRANRQTANKGAKHTSGKKP